MCYLPPDSSVYGQTSNDFFEHFTSIIFNCIDYDFTLFGGDFNARIGELIDYIPEIDNVQTRYVIDKTSNKRGNEFIDFLKSNKYCVLNGRFKPEDDNYTSISTKGLAVVDYLLTSHKGLKMCENFKVLPVRQYCDDFDIILNNNQVKLPDHSILCCNIYYSKYCQLKKETSKPTQLSVNPNNERTDIRRYKYREIPNCFMCSTETMTLVQNTIERIEHCHFNQTSVNELYDSICELYNNEIERYIPYSLENSKKKLRKCISKPWWNSNLDKLWKDAVAAEKLYIGYHGNRQRKHNLRMIYKDKINMFDKQYSKAKRSFKQKEAINIQNFLTTNPREFWKKKFSPKGTHIPLEVVFNDGADTSNDPDIVLQTWKNEFCKLYNRLYDTHVDDNFYEEVRNFKEDFDRHVIEEGTIPQTFLNSEITEEEVKKVIHKAKLGKSTGHDMLPNEVFKNLTSIKLLKQLFNLCFNSGIIPDTWRQSIINPIPKSGNKDRRVPLNYRGISLLSCVYKLYSSVLNNRLITYLETHNIIVDEQNGFRPLRACIDHLYTLTSLIRNKKAKGESLYVCFVDFQKAFDLIDRDCLLYKLAQVGLNSKMYLAIRNIYLTTYNCVRINGQCTEWFESSCGVRQGDVISPTLFNIFINDLVLEVKSLGYGIQISDTCKLSCLLYADDLALISENEKDLQAMLDVLSSWCNRWRVNVNVDKTKIVQFGKQSQNKSINVFKLSDTVIEIVTQYKYLGCILHENLDFTKTSVVLSDAAIRAFGAMQNKFYANSNMSLKVYRKLYESCICPIMDYCSGVWGYKPYNNCNATQNKVIRNFLGVNKFSSNVVINGDVGWCSPNVRHKINMIKLWNRIQKMDTSRITRMIFNWEYTLNKKTWHFECLQIFKTTNYEYIYLNKIPCNTHIIKDIENKLIELELNKWKELLHQQPKLRTYRLYKSNFGEELYVGNILSKQQRMTIAKLRSCTLPLAIETGRYINIPLENRVCKCCNNGDVENEEHFIFDCVSYSALRISFYNDICKVLPLFLESNNVSRLKQIFNDVKCLKLFATYIVNIFQIRTNIMYHINN